MRAFFQNLAGLELLKGTLVDAYYVTSFLLPIHFVKMGVPELPFISQSVSIGIRCL